MSDINDINVDAIIGYIDSFVDQMNELDELPDKTRWFMDNQASLKNCNEMIKNINEDDFVEEELNDLNEAKTKLRECIADYKNLMSVNKDISEEDTKVELTEDTISDALENKKSVQEMQQSLQEIEENDGTTNMPSNLKYAILVNVNGRTVPLFTDDKIDLSQLVTKAISTYGVGIDNIHVFELNEKKVSMKIEVN